MNYTEKILSKIREKKISKSHGRTLLIDYFYNSEELNSRIRCLQALETILPINQKSFSFLENLLVSDENAKIRRYAVKLLVKYYPNWSIESLKWVLNNESSPLVLQELFYSIKENPNQRLSTLKSDITGWFNAFGKKLGINQSESKFILDLEALFAEKEDSSYKLSEDTYSFYKFLRELNAPVNWVLIENDHIIELNFNYIKWKYLKNYSGKRNELNKYKDLDMLLSLLLNEKLEAYGSIQIPPSISSLNHLKKLDLSQNNLNSLSASIKSLDSIEYLDLSRNNLNSFPESILSMKNLKILDISYNKIKSIPRAIQSLPNLTEIRIKGNLIQSIPEFLL